MATRRMTLTGWVLTMSALLIGCGWMVNESIIDAARRAMPFGLTTTSGSCATWTPARNNG